jgi:hypothetical protein
MTDFSRDLDALHLDLCKRDCLEPPAPGCSCEASAAARATLEAAALCANAACTEFCLPKEKEADWTCLGSVQWPAPAPSLDHLTLHLKLVDAQNFSTPWMGAFEVSACGFPARGCEVPLTTVDGANALAELNIDRGASSDEFFRYLLVSGDSIDADALFYFFPPLRRSPVWAERRLVSRAFAESTATGIGVALDWNTKGGIVWSSTSCGGAPGKDIAVTVDDPTGGGARAYYFGDSGSVDINAEHTSSRGIGFITSVEPGDRTLQATVFGTAQRVGVYPVVVLAGSITHVTIVPAPNDG